MLCASDRKFAKTFIGDITFDIQRHRKRFPLFLNRNIMRVLNHHAKRRRLGSRSSSAVSLQTRPSRRKSQIDLVTPPPRSTRLRDQLIEKFHQEDAELIFDVRSIRRKLNYRENLDQRPAKRVKREAVECRCYLAVWDNREAHRQLEPILKRSGDCVVSPADTVSDAHAVEIELKSPFRIPAKEFFVPTVNRDGEVTKWAVGDKYLLEIKIIPCNTSDLWPPIPILSKSEESLTRDLVKRKDLSFTEGMLISNYTNLPHAPPVTVPLNVAFDQGGRTFKTKYGLEVHSEWTYPHYYDAKIKKEDSILAKKIEEEGKLDPLCRSVDSYRAVQTCTSRIRKLDDSPPVGPTVKASYIWDIETRTPVPRECRIASLEGLYCPICQTQEFTDLKCLQFHFVNNHDKYTFSIEDQEDDIHTKGLKCVTFRVEVAEVVRPRAANHVKDGREISWQRPEQPFDIDAYISGDQSWVGALPRRRTAAAPAQSQPFQHTTSNAVAQVDGVAKPRSTLFRSATEVSELPRPVRKRFYVPVARTMRRTSFYRSINHRAMETGEMLSETDDDIDDDWWIKRHHDTIAETEDLTAEEKEFRQRWDAHVMCEGCPSARYVSDTLVRFVRSNAAWLKGVNGNGDMLIQFQHLISLLVERGLVDARVVKDCQRIIHDGEGVGKKQVLCLTADVSDPSIPTEVLAAGQSGEVQDPNRSPEPFQQPGAHSEVEKNPAAGVETIPDQFPDGRGRSEASAGGHKTDISTPGSGPDTGLDDILQHSPPPFRGKRVEHTIANGCCATCHDYIHRPKRNAITCSNLRGPSVFRPSH
ncbi:hypothetical protein GJ744_008350 [Endocarpon pusillum]|uniref:Polycomb protein VEFS-Box domain-containing protein n=1 Tax=Endocarpon pusillum TaxID=364733 RepID=A0A8H7AHG6_9EURO|nr:hypothetical protein GJ744_008350 [Endocarpon pusillum]